MYMFWNKILVIISQFFIHLKSKSESIFTEINVKEKTQTTKYLKYNLWVPSCCYISPTSTEHCAEKCKETKSHEKKR